MACNLSEQSFLEQSFLLNKNPPSLERTRVMLVVPPFFPESIRLSKTSPSSTHHGIPEISRHFNVCPDVTAYLLSV